tara:strand:- start:85 stop:1191 length:1107 start_codon:yes stop_codon:yes gene_type:complete
MDLSKCSCDKAGFCPVFRRDMDSKNHHWCQTSSKDKKINYYQQNVGVYKENSLEEVSNIFNFPKRYNVPVNIDEVEIVTFHFNPTNSKRLTQTYYEFIHSLKNLGKYVKCYELVFDNNNPEIKNSIVIKGSLKRNCLWQKEALVNLAFKNLAKNKKYFLWVDHDLIFCNKDFLTTAIDKIENGLDFIQLFSKIQYLDKDLVNITHQCLGRVYRNQCDKLEKSSNKHGAPGGAWIASVEGMNKIFPLPDIITGSGDEWLMYGLDKNHKFMESTLALYPEQIKILLDAFRKKIEPMQIKYGYIENQLYHLWHGDHKNRQYSTRHKIIQDYNLDLLKDIFVNDQRIMEVVEEKQEVCKDVFIYLENRKEDA